MICELWFPDCCALCRYDLHVLLVNHGKRCPRCAKNGKPRKASDGDCPLFGKKGATSSKHKTESSSKEDIKSEDSDSSEEAADEKPDVAIKAEPIKEEPADTGVEGEPVHSSAEPRSDDADADVDMKEEQDV